VCSSDLQRQGSFDPSRRDALFGLAAMLSAGAVALLVGRDALAQAAKLSADLAGCRPDPDQRAGR